EHLALPDREQLRERVTRLARTLDGDRPALASLLRDGSDRIAAAGLGLTLRSFDRTLAAAALVEAPTLASLSAALSQRRLAAACGPALASVEPVPASELIGF